MTGYGSLIGGITGLVLTALPLTALAGNSLAPSHTKVQYAALTEPEDDTLDVYTPPPDLLDAGITEAELTGAIIFDDESNPVGRFSALRYDESGRPVAALVAIGEGNPLVVLDMERLTFLATLDGTGFDVMTDLSLGELLAQPPAE